MSVIQIIKDCGAKREMVYITYEGQERLVEPYSFRDGGTRFFGWCRMRDEIRGFTTVKISSARPSGNTYSPRFAVEF
ncbi:WYL domain-containing protein [Brevibacillus brevis]|uniref:WYL domain-containing protein n=1 Tax=Brevibacillus brevis TaxID=1393 RepID=UPI0019023B99|nr:hypothetical protein [Brevibacillus brevis]